MFVCVSYYTYMYLNARILGAYLIIHTCIENTNLSALHALSLCMYVYIRRRIQGPEVYRHVCIVSIYTYMYRKHNLSAFHALSCCVCMYTYAGVYKDAVLRR